MNLQKYTLILASKSPRRKELLEYLGIPFETIPSDIEETGDETNPCELAVNIAKDKGLFVYKKLESRSDFGKTFFPLVIGCDTIVVLDKKVYGKPKDGLDASRMLLELSGRTHQVITGVHLGRFDFEQEKYLSKEFYISSKVKFEVITQDILDNYLSTEDSRDKAGAYGIQGPSLTFISNLEGSYSNVVGFPLSDFLLELKEFLGHPDDQSGKWRSLFSIP